MQMTTYTITIVSDEMLEDLNGGSPYAEFADPPVSYGGKTYTGFKLVETGSFAGSYQGYAEGDEVIFYGNEVASVVEEK